MIRAELRSAIAASAARLFGKEQVPDFSLEAPENPEHGDYAANIALLLAKKLGKNPLEVADALAADLKNSQWAASVAGPGFLNFKISPMFLEKEFKEILKRKEKYGSAPAKSKKIQVEFISANPTGPLTLANGRGGFLGDALANIFLRAGYKTEREYYVNDAGNQIVTLGKSLLAVAGVIPEEEQFYKGEYIKTWAAGHASIIKKFKNNPESLGKAAAEDFLKNIKKVIEKKSGIRFDRYTSEDRDIHKKGFAKKAFELFQKKGLMYEKEGAQWLKTTDFGDDKDRVLMTSEGYPTYFLADAGHYLETKLRKFDAKINIVGPDHYGYVKRIQAAAEIIGLEESEVIVTQAIRLMHGTEEVKMSKRKGEFVEFEELVDEVGHDTARYFFLEKSPHTHIDFDLNLARERSTKNPVYYIQYAYVRAQSILKKAESSRPKSKRAGAKKTLELLQTVEERALVKKLIQFPEIIEDTAKDFAVHRVTRYLLLLARAFHNFYEKNRVITADADLTRARIELDKAVVIVLGIALDVLGVSKPKKM
ncbi:MAG: arginine--tRNA ligase [Candidatus Sungbacteria bacterium]|nr:arginine--tRNA ligase [Candidatus Sungbacteria bacterium]